MSWKRFAGLAAPWMVLGFCPTLNAADPAGPTPVPAGTPVTITVQPPAPSTPPFTIVLAGRHGHVTPIRSGCTHTGGGNIDIAQPSTDTVIITMTGAAIADPFVCPSRASMQCDLEQCFEITFDNPKIKKAKMTLEGRVIGLLRGRCAGCASFGDAAAVVTAGAAPILETAVPPHSVGPHEFLSVNDHQGPCSVPIVAGKFVLHQTFTVNAETPCSALPYKGPSAEFAPDPALDPLWLPYREPFHGAAKKDFGFQVVLKVVEETAEEEAAAPAPEVKEKAQLRRLPPLQARSAAATRNIIPMPAGIPAAVRRVTPMPTASRGYEVVPTSSRGYEVMPTSTRGYAQRTVPWQIQEQQLGSSYNSSTWHPSQSAQTRWQGSYEE